MKTGKHLYTVVIFLALFVFAAFSTTFGILLNPLISHYDLRMARQGYPSAAMNVGCAAALCLSFGLVRKLGKARVMGIAVAATAIFTLPMGAAPGFPAFIALSALMGIAVGLIDTLCSSGVAELYTGRTGATVMCMLHAIFGAAGVAMPKLIDWLMSRGMVWNHVYFGIGLMALCVALYAVPVCLKAQKQALLRLDQGGISLSAVRDFLSDKNRVLVIAGTALYVASLSNTQLWIDRYMSLHLMREDLAALSLSLFWLGLTVSRVAMSFIKITPLTYLRWAPPLAGLALLAGLWSGNGAAMCALCALSSLLNGAVVPIALCELCGRYSGNSMVATTVTFICIYLVQFVMPLAVGALTDSVGLSAALYPAAICTILSGGAAMLVRPAAAQSN